MSYLETIDLDVRTIIDKNVHILKLNDVINELVLTQNCEKYVCILTEKHSKLTKYDEYIREEYNFDTYFCYNTSFVKYDNPHNIPSNITNLHIKQKVYYTKGEYEGELRKNRKNIFINIDKYGNTWLDIWKVINELYLLSNDSVNDSFYEFKKYNKNTLTCCFIT